MTQKIFVRNQLKLIKNNKWKFCLKHFYFFISEVYEYLSCETQGNGNNEDSPDDKQQKLLEQCRNILNIFELTYDISGVVEDSSYLDMSANCNIISKYFFNTIYYCDIELYGLYKPYTVWEGKIKTFYM